MGTITARKRKDGSIGYMARVRVVRDGEAYHETETFDRRPAAAARSAQRDRRPTLDELDRLIGHFIERRKKAPQSMPMHKVIAFALFSTRRQEEITRIKWKDFQREHKRVLVRDMKHPGEKIGNHTWVDLPDQAIQIIGSMPKSKSEIFPYSTDAISANFTRACKLLDIDDLVIDTK